ncbi:MAG: response regulator [Magnetococcales bacterium]|nr:response regulator [Magnetococcales bacterium]
MPGSDLKPARVLVVDDMPENIEILYGCLKDEFAVMVANHGARALRLAAAHPQPDLVLLDVMMPEMDGYEVCLRLRSDPSTWGIPVIFVTALSGDDDECRGLTVGAVDYITKPFNPDLVRARVRSHLELKHHKDHLEELVVEGARELIQTQEAAMISLAALAEARDKETGAHIRRTKSYMRLMVEAIEDHPELRRELPEEHADLIYKSAPLHDIGKVGTPDHILLKPGRLTEEEFKEMKRHAFMGYSALREAIGRLGKGSFLHHAAEIAYTHHEKWDGSGYPRGLKGEQIPLSGRLMAVADVYDALISKRVYKSAMAHEEALEILRAGRGTHFDPRIIDLFLALHEKMRQIALENEDAPEVPAEVE